MANFLFDLVRASIHDKDRLFLETPDGIRMTYSDLFDETARYAHVFRQLGIKQGDRIAVQLEKSPAVIGLAHPDFGEGVVAVIVREKGSTINERNILAGIDGRLARFKLPKKIFFVDELPRNTMGKVQKNLLRDRYKNLQFD